MDSTVSLPTRMLVALPERGIGRWLGVVASLLIHAALIGVIVFGWPEVFTVEPPTIPVTVVPDPSPEPPPQVKPPAQTQTPPAPAPAPALPPGAPSSQPGAPPAADSAQVAGVTAQVAKCWTAPSGWTKPDEVAVTVAFPIGADGAVAAPPTVIAFRPTPLGIAAAKAALDAVVACGPYPGAAKHTVEVRLAPGG